MPLRKEALPENSLVVRPEYLKAHSGVVRIICNILSFLFPSLNLLSRSPFSQNDLVRRLQELSKILAEDESIDPDSAEWPGLAALANYLVQAHLLHHKSKDVRLYTVLNCMEIFAIYAPEIPWDQDQIIDIFEKTNEQLANLAHTTGPANSYFHVYNRILELLAEVKIGIVLVELAQQTGDDQALDCLAHLISTLLHAAHNEHPHQVMQRIVTSIIACLDEYDRGAAIAVPIPVLDVILLAICAGPTRVELKQGTSAVPVPTQVPNASYAAAASVIRRTQNQTATPIAELINSILNGDEVVRSKSNILIEPSKDKNDVWTVIYQLNRIAPQTLTTVIGTVANLLESTHNDTRKSAVQLLGKLFASSSTTVSRFHSCFVIWLKRHKDIETSIRMKMVPSIVRIAIGGENSAIENLIRMITNDPSVDVRLECIHESCEIMYACEDSIPHDVLRAVGNRVASKHPKERRDALTGISRIYHKHYVAPTLKKIQEGGDDVEIGVILSVLHKECPSFKSNKRHASDESNSFQWIPGLVFKSAFYKDSDDTEMRSRVIKIIDEILLGSDLPSSNKTMSPTARATALAIILNGMADNDTLEESDGFKYMMHLFSHRAMLQASLSAYIDARNETRKCEAGSEESLSKDANAMQMLRRVAYLCPPSPSKADGVLEAVHGIRDQHVFRILASLTQAKHSLRSRVRALDELPKRAKSAGNAAVEWIMMLIHRLSMGEFFNNETIVHCCLLAQECFYESDFASCALFLSCVKAATKCFPSLASSKKVCTTLTELFTECRSTSDPKKLKPIREKDILTSLTAILSVASNQQSKGTSAIESAADEEFQTGLFQLIKDGTPEQISKSVCTLAGIYNTYDEEKSDEAFLSLLKAISSPARLSLNGDSQKLVGSLQGLSSLAQCRVEVFDCDRGAKAIKFALEGLIMGKSLNDSITDESSVSSSVSSPSPSRKSRKSKSSRGSMSLGNEISDTCRAIEASISFLATYIRAFCFKAPRQDGRGKLNPIAIRFFELMSQILIDDGLPPSFSARAECSSKDDLAALRCAAAVNMLRLCDSRLGLDHLISFDTWTILGSAFLDPDTAVREGVFSVFKDFLTGGGSFSSGTGLAQAPNLRFVAYAVFCSNGIHTGNDEANGGAAHVASITEGIRRALSECVAKLRGVCDATYSQCKSMGKEQEQKFEKLYKMKFMPEYILPFALFLLSQRPETPYSTQTSPESDESSERVLRKRLSVLIDPLVQSLGEAADNISFLLRMCEILAKHYIPSTTETSAMDSTSSRLKLQQVCSTARDVLLSFVKKDVNLESYPGQILVHSKLFKLFKGTSTVQPTSEPTADSPLVEAKRSPQERTVSQPPTRQSRSSGRGSIKPRSSAGDTKTKVHFSPEVTFKSRRGKDLSPIPKSSSPTSVSSPASKRKSPSNDSAATLNSSPPSTLEGATIRSTLPDEPDSPADTSGTSSTSSRRLKRSRRSSPSPPVLSGVRARVLGKGKTNLPAQINVKRNASKLADDDALEFEAENMGKTTRVRKSSSKQTRALRSRTRA